MQLSPRVPLGNTFEIMRHGMPRNILNHVQFSRREMRTNCQYDFNGVLSACLFLDKYRVLILMFPFGASVLCRKNSKQNKLESTGVGWQ